MTILFVTKLKFHVSWLGRSGRDQLKIDLEANTMELKLIQDNSLPRSSDGLASCLLPHFFLIADKDLVHWAQESDAQIWTICLNPSMEHLEGKFFFFDKQHLEGNKHGKWLSYWRHMYIMLIAVQFSCILTAGRPDQILVIM